MVTAEDDLTRTMKELSKRMNEVQNKQDELREKYRKSTTRELLYLAYEDELVFLHHLLQTLYGKKTTLSRKPVKKTVRRI